MFSSARWRLALWFAMAMALALAMLGATVYLTARHLVLAGVDAELRTRAERELPLLTVRLHELWERRQPLQGIRVGPEGGISPYFYALLGPAGQVLAATGNPDATVLPTAEEMQKALAQGPQFLTVRSLEGEQIRLYLGPVSEAGRLVLLVGRSIGPELAALRNLLFILVGGGVAALALSLVGGYFLAGLALRPIREAMDRQRAFIADASHELRTPLSLIRASAELLRRHPQDPISAHQQEVEDIVAESDRLSRLTSQLLTLARADARRLPLHKEEVDLAHLAQDVARQLAPRAQEKGLALEVSAPGPLPLWADAARLREILHILLDNAIKFTPSGGQVRVRLRRQGPQAHLEVSDTGVGIDPQDLPHIFDRFYRGDRARTRGEEDGTGLGLAIAKAIVEAHGGRIWAKSRPGEGTTFTVLLPQGD